MATITSVAPSQPLFHEGHCTNINVLTQIALFSLDPYNGNFELAGVSKEWNRATISAIKIDLKKAQENLLEENFIKEQVVFADKDKIENPKKFLNRYLTSIAKKINLLTVLKYRKSDNPISFAFADNITVLLKDKSIFGELIGLFTQNLNPINPIDLERLILKDRFRVAIILAELHEPKIRDRVGLERFYLTLSEKWIEQNKCIKQARLFFQNIPQEKDEVCYFYLNQRIGNLGKKLAQIGYINDAIEIFKKCNQVKEHIRECVEELLKKENFKDALELLVEFSKEISDVSFISELARWFRNERFQEVNDILFNDLKWDPKKESYVCILNDFFRYIREYLIGRHDFMDFVSKIPQTQFKTKLLPDLVNLLLYRGRDKDAEELAPLIEDKKEREYYLNHHLMPQKKELLPTSPKEEKKIELPIENKEIVLEEPKKVEETKKEEEPTKQVEGPLSRIENGKNFVVKFWQNSVFFRVASICTLGLVPLITFIWGIIFKRS